MARQKWRGGAMLAPVPPALVSLGEGEEKNILTVAWTGILSTVPPRTYVSIRPERHSHALIEKTGEFVINLPTARLARAVDFCGMYTGAKMDKFVRAGLSAIPSEAVGCPTVAECPLALECRVFEKKELGSHDMYLADIVAVTVDESLLDESGKLCLARAGLLAYAHGEYFALGDNVGKFGFSAVKRKKKPKGAQKSVPRHEKEKKSSPEGKK